MTTPANDTLTTKAIAEKLGTDARTLRVFLRASNDYEGVGSGSRYAFTAKDVPTLKNRFNKWLTDRTTAKKAKDDDDASKDEAEAS